jgi:hypothetical protein
MSNLLEVVPGRSYLISEISLCSAGETFEVGLTLDHGGTAGSTSFAGGD